MRAVGSDWLENGMKKGWKRADKDQELAEIACAVSETKEHGVLEQGIGRK